MLLTDAEHIRELVASRKAKMLPIQVSRDFGRYLESCPLQPPLGASIDWSGLPARSSIEWYEASDQDLIEWARALKIGRFSHIALWYNSDEPCILTDFEFGIANLDTLTWGAPGSRYLFGVDLREGNYACSFDAFLEVTGGRLLHGTTEQAACHEPAFVKPPLYHSPGG